MTLSKFAESLPENYGYVLLTATGSIFVNVWLSMNVGRARKKYEVAYPQLYHQDPSHIFNCIQRAHQNYLEGYPQFMVLLFAGGLQYPKTSAGMGLMYLVGRIAYAKGYYTGDPEKRRWGGFLHIAELVLLGNLTSLAFQNLGWWPFHK